MACNVCGQKPEGEIALDSLARETDFEIVRYTRTRGALGRAQPFFDELLCNS